MKSPTNVMDLTTIQSASAFFKEGPDISLGRLLTKIMDCNLTVSDLAKLSDVSREQISRIMKGSNAKAEVEAKIFNVIKEWMESRCIPLFQTWQMAQIHANNDELEGMVKELEEMSKAQGIEV